MTFRFMYRTVDISELSHSRSLDSADIYISCSVHTCEWYSMYVVFTYVVLKQGRRSYNEADSFF